MTWFDLARMATRQARLDASTLDAGAGPCDAMPLAAPRPRYAVPVTVFGGMPPIDVRWTATSTNVRG